MTALLEVQNLEKQFPIVGSRKVVQAVNGVDFIIDSGETLALVGESGSGKTTVGRAIVGLIEATAGEIRFDGKLMGRGRNIRSNSIGAIAQAVGRIPCSAEKGFAQFVDRFVNVAGEGGSRKALGSLL